MRKTTTILILAMGAIGLIGIVESIANFSLFQTFVSTALVWGAFAFYGDMQKSLKDETE